MITVNVLIDSVDKVKRFSSILSSEEGECELVEGVHIVDARSVMGIFSLDLSRPIQLNVHTDNQELLNKIRDFIVEA